MASSTASSTHIEPSLDQRLALSHLLLELFRTLDHDAIFNARSSHTKEMIMDLEQGEILSDTDTNREAEAFLYPEALTMHVVLADALQYLQIMKLGFIASREVRGYSYKELIMTLKGLVMSSEAPRASHPSENGSTSSSWTDREYNCIQSAVKLVIAQLEKGTWPIEPVARIQQSTHSVLSSPSGGMAPFDNTYQTARFGFIRRSPGAISALFTNPNAQASSQAGTDATHSHTSSSTPVPVRKCPSAVAAAYEAAPHPESRVPTWSDWSNCSITPSESISQVPFRGKPNTKVFSYVRKPGSLSAIFNDPQQYSAPLPKSKVAIGGNGMPSGASTEKQEPVGLDVALERLECLIDQRLQEE